MIPLSISGVSFVHELARLLQAFVDGSSMESVCMKAVTIVQVLVLHRTSKVKVLNNHLKRRMDLWKSGDLDEILQEGRCIQGHLPKVQKQT